MDTDAQTPISITLSQDEALVAFETLSRLLEDRQGADLIALARHDAELWAFSRLLGRLERELGQPFRPDYAEAVQAAQERLSQECGGRWPAADE